MSKDFLTICVIGNPNTGKSTVFNALSGAKQKVANYPGVTIEKRSAFIDLPFSKAAELIDLPGCYSLRAVSQDERVAIDSLMGRVTEKPDKVLFILDAINLKRNLLLFSQVIETGLPVIIGLTMTDLLKSEETTVDIENLERLLQVPIIAVNVKNPKSIEQLKLTLADDQPNNHSYSYTNQFYPEKILPILHSIKDSTVNENSLANFEICNLALFENDPLKSIIPNTFFSKNQSKLNEIKATVTVEQLNQKRFQWARTIVNQAEKRSPRTEKSISEKIDKVLTHRFFGLVIFVAIMYLIFQSIYAWAAPLMDALEASFSYLGYLIGQLMPMQSISRSLIVDGIINGVGAVVVFLPQIIILFTFIAILEASGYLARASFLMDKLLSWTGLNGRSFIPMLSSFACAVPGVMSARVMADEKLRKTTILIAPLMSCSARLPVYLLMIGAFIEPRFGAGWAAFALFMMHTVGLIIALPLAYILNRGFFKSPISPFILELPRYRMPYARNIYYRVQSAIKKFLIRAGSTILALSVVIWALSYFPRDINVANDITAKAMARISVNHPINKVTLKKEIAAAYLENSYLGRTGKFIQPVFAPLGFDWKLTVGILSAFPAREVIISTLGIIYNVEDTSDDITSLKEKLLRERKKDGSKAYTPLVAISLMIFFALCCQCLSTVVTVQKELNSWFWAAFLFFYMTSLAYVLSMAVYQGGLAMGFH